MNPRQQQIADLVVLQGQVHVPALAQQFGVSLMTVRRDLVLLEAQGRLHRTHGGAVPSRTGIVEFSFAARSRRCCREKAAIARAAAELIPSGATIALDTGTTTLELAHCLRHLMALTVLTTSLPIASCLHGCDNIELVLLGGLVRRDCPDLTGSLTEENLGRFRVDLAFVGADAMDETGVWASDLRVARVSQAMLAAAQTTCVLADSSKWQTSALTRYAQWQSLSTLVSDGGLPRLGRQIIEQAGCRVVLAPAGLPAGRQEKS